MSRRSTVKGGGSTAWPGTSSQLTSGAGGAVSVSPASALRGSTLTVGGWITDVALDFTAESSQTLSSDTTYTIGGRTWTKINSTNDATAMAVTNGQGLVITPKATGDYVNNTRTLPAITVPLTSLVTGITLTTPIRVTVAMSTSNEAASFDQTVFAVERWTGSTMTSSYGMRRVMFSGTPLSNAHRTVSGTTTSSDLAAQYSNKAMQIVLPCGVQGGTLRMLTADYTSGEPPANASFSAHSAGATAPAGGIASSTIDGAIGDWTLLIGALRAGSATSYVAKVTYLKVEHLAAV